MKNINKKVYSLDLTPFRRGFTMLELIFVIILISILSSIGIGFIPNHDVMNDTNFISMQVKEKQKNALNYDTNAFTTRPWYLVQNSLEYNLTCIELDKDVINTIEASKNEQKTYQIKTDIISSLASKTLCFDFLGRPYEHDTEQLLLQNVDINVSDKHISVFPMSGYVKIN